MMKWGRKKQMSSPSSPRPASGSRMFPTSWLSRFKQNCGSFKNETRKERQKEKLNVQSEVLPMPGQQGSHKTGRFCAGDDDDAFWRISFGEDRERGGNNFYSALYQRGNEIESRSLGVPSSRTTMREVAKREEGMNFSAAVSKIRNTRELSKNSIDFSSGFNASETVMERVEPEPRKPKKGGKQDGKLLEKTTPRLAEDLQEFQREVADETEAGVRKSKVEEEEDTLGFDLKVRQSLSSLRTNSDIKTAEEEENAPGEDFSPELSKLKDLKIQETMSISGFKTRSISQKRSVQKRTKQSSRVRVYSPRTASRVEFCKIKALQNMKAAKMKMKKSREGPVREGAANPESFAIVKCSFDPHKDFRDSMFEMITEKRITRSSELEELLACYLTLNSDEYHDLIIKVFRQVWFDLNHHDSFGLEPHAG